MHFSKAFAFIWILSLAEKLARKRIIEGRNFLNFRHADLVDNFFLLFKELIGVDFNLLGFGWFGICRGFFRGWILCSLRITPFQFGELLEFLLFASLLLRVYIRDNLLPLRLTILWLNYWQ